MLKLFLCAIAAFGGTALIAAVLLATNDPMEKVEVSTIGSGPSELTPAELQKFIEAEKARLAESKVTPSPGEAPATANTTTANTTTTTTTAKPQVAAEKPAPFTTIVIGPPGLSAQDIAKRDATREHAQPKSNGEKP